MSRLSLNKVTRDSTLQGRIFAPALRPFSVLPRVTLFKLRHINSTLRHKLLQNNLCGGEDRIDCCDVLKKTRYFCNIDIAIPDFSIYRNIEKYLSCVYRFFDKYQ